MITIKWRFWDLRVRKVLYLSGNRGIRGNLRGDFFCFGVSYQHRVDKSVEKLHLSNESETNVESGIVENFFHCRGGVQFRKLRKNAAARL